MSDPFIGEVRIFAGNFTPRDWAFCDGQTLPVDQYTALFAIVSAMYGGNGRTDFGVPDLNGRAAMHAGTGPGLSSHPLSQKAGAANVTLSNANMPTHSHALGGLAPTLSRDDEGSPANNTLQGVAIYADATSSTVTLASASVESVGANGAHENRHPYLAVNFIIALNGVFPTQS